MGTEEQGHSEQEEQEVEVKYRQVMEKEAAEGAAPAPGRLPASPAFAHVCLFSSSDINNLV